jgi:hypothetical protein
MTPTRHFTGSRTLPQGRGIRAIVGVVTNKPFSKVKDWEIGMHGGLLVTTPTRAKS